MINLPLERLLIQGSFKSLDATGMYKVTINPDSDVAAKEIPAKYKSRTPLEVEVGKGKSNFQFELI